MTLHEDVLERILNILKQDDYYRTLEDLPVIDDLTAYDDIRLFPELYDTITIIKRITSKADLIKRQLRQLGMYLLHMNSLPSTSTFVPRPTSTFEPISPQKVMTPDTYKLNQHFRDTISGYTSTAVCTFTTTTMYPHTNASHITKTP